MSIQNGSIHTEASRVSWEPLAPGVQWKRLSPAAEQEVATAGLLRLEAGANLPAPASGWSREWLLLEGDLVPHHSPGGDTDAGDHGPGKFGPGDYGFLPAGSSFDRSTTSGAVLFVKEARDSTGGAGDAGVVCSRADETPWVPGHGNLRVKPLDPDRAAGGAALVHWPAGERFVPHQHWGGEEIYVLSGTFCDEHGHYPAGTWIRSPHLSTHHPYVEEETVIYVKTGHLGG